MDDSYLGGWTVLTRPFVAQFHPTGDTSTMQVVCALIKADTDFELLLMVGSGHGSCENRYGQRRRADFFIRHLQGVESSTTTRDFTAEVAENAEKGKAIGQRRQPLLLSSAVRKSSPLRPLRSLR